MLIAGVDEVGRGPIAGPVVAAAVILDPNQPIEGITDSKKLSARRREQLAAEIMQKAIAWSIGRAEVEEIDQLNILQASLVAMRRAVSGLSCEPDQVLVDGNQVIDVPYPCLAIIKGDLTEQCIGAASIIAKVNRDAEMRGLDEQYPGYGLAQHKGYPTKLHLQALQTLGVTPLHRRSFAPVKRQLAVEMTD